MWHINGSNENVIAQVIAVDPTGTTWLLRDGTTLRSKSFQELRHKLQARSKDLTEVMVPVEIMRKIEDARCKQTVR